MSPRKDTVNALSSSWCSREPVISRLTALKKQFPSPRIESVASGGPRYSLDWRSGIFSGAGSPKREH
ncbi:hypothetical protein PoB_002823300 [Plakobranchus ocellatus]|uniref:Uncharacterized protein n=1 Tax=Plakobranchus ocellatus TaxID=259542 RepID=A0AAV4A4U8_9GAST|nr:hypothetical protein PoB_002823300 [Plakobranchus ocellatus]